jgi:hypothetical protein
VLAVRFLLSPHEEVVLVHAIDWSVARNFAASDAGECREEVDDGNDLIADAPARNLARPCRH